MGNQFGSRPEHPTFPRPKVKIILRPDVFPPHLHERIIAQIKAYNKVKNYVPEDHLDDPLPQTVKPDYFRKPDWGRLNWRRALGDQAYIPSRKDRTDRVDDFDEASERSDSAALSVTWLILGLTTMVLIVFVVAHFYYESREWHMRDKRRTRLRQLQREQEEKKSTMESKESIRCPPNSEYSGIDIASWLSDVESPDVELATYHPVWAAARRQNGASECKYEGLDSARIHTTSETMETVLDPVEASRRASATGQQSAELARQLRKALSVRKKDSILSAPARSLRRFFSSEGSEQPVEESPELTPLERRLSLINVLGRFRM